MQKSELEYIAKQASSLYLSHGSDLNTSIFQLANQSGLNHEQTKRVVEMTNSIVNATLVKEAKANGQAANLHFKTAKLDEIKKLHSAHTGPDAEALSKLASMFIVPDLTDNDFDMNKVADAVDTRAVLSDMDTAALAGAYIRNEIEDGQAFTLDSFDDAIIFLEEVVTEAKVASELSHADMTLAANALRSTVIDLIRDGTTPATLKKIAGDQHAKNIDVLVKAARRELGLVDQAKTAAALGFTGIDDDGDGENQLQPGAIVLPDHPFVRGLARVDELLGELKKIANAQQRAEGAVTRAKSDYKAAAASEKVAFVPSSITKKLPGGGGGGGMLGHVFNGVGGYAQAKSLTQQLKQRQAAPAVGALKMADEKEAGIGKALGVAATMTLAATAAGLIGKGLDLGFMQIGKAFKSSKEQQLFSELVKMDPTFGTNPRARDAFDILSKYAPALLKSPRVAHDFISKQMQYPQSSVEFIQSLTQTQKLHNEGMRAGPGLGSSLSATFTGAFAGGLKDNP